MAAAPLPSGFLCAVLTKKLEEGGHGVGWVSRICNTTKAVAKYKQKGIVGKSHPGSDSLNSCADDESARDSQEDILSATPGATPGNGVSHMDSESKREQAFGQ